MPIRENGHDRDDGRAPALQEHDHHEHHKGRGLEEGLVDLVDALGDELRGIVDDLVSDSRREIRFELLHGLDDLLRSSQCICAGPLEDCEGHSRLSVQVRIRHVILGPEFDAGDVLQPHKMPLAGGLDDDRPELARIFETALRCDRQLESGIRWCRLLPQGTTGNLDVLLLDSADHVTRGHAVGGEFLRIEPDAYGVLPLAEDGEIAHALKAQQDVADVIAGIIRDVELVVGAVR